MKESDIRAEVYNLLRRLWYWPITQTDLNAPFDISAVNRLIGSLIGMTKGHQKIQSAVFALKAVLDKAVARPPKGRPDILVLCPSNNRSLVVEVKALNLLRQKSFAFSEISPEQRQWLDRWEADGGWGFIAIGTCGVPAGQRKLWIVLWNNWKNIEDMIRPIQDSIPYQAGKGFRTELQEKNWDLIHLLERWEMYWENGCWHAQTGHMMWPGFGHTMEREL